MNTNKIHKATSPILGEVLKVGDTIVATIAFNRSCNNWEVNPTHGYYPRHPYAKRVKAWAKRRGYLARLYV